MVIGLLVLKIYRILKNIFYMYVYRYVEYQKNHIKLDLNSTLKCFSTTSFWWMYLT